MPPKVSVLIPTHNRRNPLQKAVASVLAQTFTDWELIVIDDGSTDETIAWWDKQNFPESFRLVRQDHRGVSTARNRGLEIARGEWIALLDSDDEWLPEKLLRQLQCAAESNAPLIHGEEIWIRNGVRVNPKKKHRKSGGRIFKSCLPLCCVSPSATMIRRSLLQELGGFREDFPVCEDYEMWLRICSRHDAGFVGDPIVIKHGGHADQLSRRYVAMDFYRVQAMSFYMDSPDITADERRALLQEMIHKADILLKGYQKHSNFKDDDAVREWRNQAQARFSADFSQQFQAQSAHSTTDN